ncbi:MAG TPA: hypothetical protein ENO24_02810 [Chloroflexi bacterium]|nr:hypothetical protein [Chloroflexota bacterium]
MEFYKGVVRSYDETTHTANVLLVGSMSRVLMAMPVSHQIGSELMEEGRDCGVLFFADGATGVVLCTFDGAPGPWVRPEDLTFSPATPEFGMLSSSADQDLTNSWATYQSLSQQVVVPNGKTISALVVGTAEFECTSFTSWNLDTTRVWRGGTGTGTGVSSAHALRTNAANDRGTVTVVGAEKITATATYTLGVYKALDRNTEVCHRGSLVVAWWEDT